MTDDRLQILQMVREGKVTPDQAAKLLDALEQPSRPKEPNAARAAKRQVRVQIWDGGRPKSFSVNLGVARWVLGLGGVFSFSLGSRNQSLDGRAMLEAIEKGAPGKVFEAEENGNRIEVWLDE
ncbi:MAG TPA: hypothetical protein VGK74_15880 [Symbiobacteriaceae bacterium]|jgi:hypothetical protein